MKNIDLKEFIEAMDALEEEKGISKDYIIEALEEALVKAYKQNYDVDENSDNVKVTIDKATGELHLYSEREVVKELAIPEIEISLKEARKIDKNYKVGDKVNVEVIPRDFGRIAAQKAKQVVVQKIREAEKNMVYNEFNDKKGEIVTGLIQKVDDQMVVMDLGKLEGVMPRKEQIPGEVYRVNDKIKGYVLEVKKGLKGTPVVTVSRGHYDFVRKLFEFEIPEIYEGLIEIKSVSRDPGSRSKVAVYSRDENIDPVGSCVGQKGVRIQNIINELNGEKIDVIEWNEDPAIFIAAALLPAQVMAVDVHEDEKFAQVIVPDDQLSLAIGKSGQNARLAARLTNWKIDIKSETQIREILLKQMAEEEGQTVETETAEVSQEPKETVKEVEEASAETVEVKEEVKVEESAEEPVEEPKKKRAGRKKKEETEVEETKTEEPAEEVKPKRRGRPKKSETKE